MTADYAVFCGLDVGKHTHHATPLDHAGGRLHDGELPQDEAPLRALFTGLQSRGPVLVVVDQPATIGALPIAVARDCGCQVAYLPGLAMRRLADLHPGQAKTDARDAFVIADAARTLPHTLRKVDVGEEALAELKVLKKVLDAHPLAEVLISMPGVGVRTAARILLEVGDGSSFPTACHLAAYAGLAPVTRRSRSSIRGEHPRRSGSKHLKRAFFLCAFAAPHDPTSRAYYDRKRAEGKKHNAALICLARRRCDVLFAMLRDQQPYRPPMPAAA